MVPSGCAWPNNCDCPVWYCEGSAPLTWLIGWMPSRFSTGMKFDICFLLLSCRLRRDDALEEPIAHGHVAGPSNQLHHRVLVDREPIRVERDHVAILVRTKEDVIRHQHVHARGRS